MIVTGAQAQACQDYYDAQVQANLTADYTLLAAGSRTAGDGIPWPVCESVSSLTIGNYVTTGKAASRDGIW